MNKIEKKKNASFIFYERFSDLDWNQLDETQLQTSAR